MPNNFLILFGARFIAMNKRGLYIHIPFCASKCSYCDFYSFKPSDEIIDQYLFAVIEELKKYKTYEVDTLYIGGGTPSLIGAKRLTKLLKNIRELFGDFTEATIEANPADNLMDFFKAAKAGGINRVSLGVQTANENELASLSRRHSNADVIKAVEDCKAAGITNISLDLMLGIPSQTEQSLEKSIDFLVGLEPTHISAYILKLEQGTPLYSKKDSLSIPDGDATADLYLKAVNCLAQKGFKQYEISNFCKSGFPSLHNLKYWHGEEYIGIGPAAHGYLDGKRYSYPRDVEKFINSPEPVFDTSPDKAEEYLMLGLRLTEGVTYEKLGRFGYNITAIKTKVDLFKKHGLITETEQGFALTTKGFLVSNSIIVELLEQ